MNLIQRIVLVLGAVVVVLVTIFTPRVVIVEGQLYFATNFSDVYPPVIDVRTVGTLVIAVLAVTGLLWAALRNKRPEE